MKNKIMNKLFIFLLLSTSMVAMGMHRDDERQNTLAILRSSYTTEELDNEIAETSELIQELALQLDASQHQLQCATTDVERALIESEHYNIKNSKDWFSDRLELLKQVREER